MSFHSNPMLPFASDRCQCPTCKEYFNSTRAFDKHRTGEFASTRRCLSPSEMVGKGMARGTSGHWVTALRGGSAPVTVRS